MEDKTAVGFVQYFYHSFFLFLQNSNFETFSANDDSNPIVYFCSFVTHENSHYSYCGEKTQMVNCWTDGSQKPLLTSMHYS